MIKKSPKIQVCNIDNQLVKKYILSLLRNVDNLQCVLITEDLIPKDEFIIEYSGEIVDIEEIEYRYIKYKVLEKKYSSQASYGNNCLKLINGYYIDSNISGNISKHITHSCQPNCDYKSVYREFLFSIDNGSMKLLLYSIIDIKANSELTVDYRRHHFNL